MNALRGVLAIAAVDVRRMLRDRTARFFIFVFPFVIILVIGATIAGADRYAVGIVDLDGGPLASQLVDALRGQPTLDLQTFAGQADAATAVRHGQVVSAVVVPAGYGAALEAGRGSTVSVLVQSSTPLPAPVQTALASAVATQGIRIGAAQFAVRTQGTSFDVAVGLADRLAPEATTTGTTTQTVGSHGAALPAGLGYTAPSNLVLFVFLTSITGVIGLIESRRLGIGRRMVAAPVSTPVLLGGVVAGRIGVAVVQALIILAGGVVLRVEWGDPLAATVLVVVFCAVGAGAGMVIATLVSSPQLAISVGIPLSIAFGMLGGCMWPLEIVGPTMQAVGHITPQAWAMDGFIKLVTSDAHLADIGLQVLVLAAFAVVLLGAGTLRLRRSLAA